MNSVEHKEIKINKHTKERQIRRNNAKLYPIYKMFSWDLLCFYSIEFLFYTITKGITASEVLILSACYILFKILMQTSAVTITDMLGHRKSLIIGNGLVLCYLVLLIISSDLPFMIFACLIRALGYDIKVIVETNLLYDSVSTKGGEGLYSKLEAKGAAFYYLLDGILCLATGYLFVFNNYLPIILCMIFIIISTILSFKFKDVHKIAKVENKKNTSFAKTLREYRADLRQSIKFIIKSNRMKSYIIFGSIFYGIITILDTYRSDLLIAKGIPEEQYAMIFAILTLLAGFSATLSTIVHRKFRNKTLTVISLIYILCGITVGIVAHFVFNSIAIPIIIFMYTIMKMSTSIWYVLEYKYLKNFTTEEIRNRIMFTYELIGGIVTSVLALIGSLILRHIEIDLAFLLVTSIGFIAIALSLKYMKTRFGLRPKEYKKEDIEFK